MAFENGLSTPDTDCGFDFDLEDILVHDVVADLYSINTPSSADASSWHRPRAQADFAPSISNQLTSPSEINSRGNNEQYKIPFAQLFDKQPVGSQDVPLSSTTTTVQAPVKEQPKIGTRFSSSSLKFLRAWILNHQINPYPMAGDLEMLQKQTGLGRQQILNWFGNARRRMKFQTLRSPQQPTFGPDGRRIFRPDSPAPLDQMDPLQRWQNSPPEHEPAVVSAIAQAVSGFSSQDFIPSSRIGSSEGERAQSFCSRSSAGSAGTSQSSASSFASSRSRSSHVSPGALDSLKRSSKRRRRRQLLRKSDAPGFNTLSETLHPYQCTFCTETFKTKHNWHRHEKSLHLSLERWECSPKGPTVMNHNSEMSCVFCGLVDPDTNHFHDHDYITCQTRLPEERTFFRKDHLQQHLTLVHGAKFAKWPMDQWKSEDKAIRSRCGFCDLVMGSWLDRVNHIAHHFKLGQTMADWEGDWGFDDRVLEMVENAMPPYLIHYERNSPWPFTTKQGPPETPANVFELLKLELEYFVTNHLAAEGHELSDQELQYECCCIIFGSEIKSKGSTTSAQSWVRDLLMSSDAITKKARLRPIQGAAKSRITQLNIHGKETIFDMCPMEEQLSNFVEISNLLNLEMSDNALQREACNIVSRAEASSATPPGIYSSLLTNLISNSTCWLTPFRRRMKMEPGPGEIDCSTDVFDDGNKMTECSTPEVPLEAAELAEILAPPTNLTQDTKLSDPGMAFCLTDSNCYRRLARELTQFVERTISPRNPNHHVPTDEELQYQARWLMFGDDDPWNQTPADNENWLRQFKRDIGLDSDESNSKGSSHTNC